MRIILGAASFSNSSRFPFNSSDSTVIPVAFLPGRAKLAMIPFSIGKLSDTKYDGNC